MVPYSSSVPTWRKRPTPARRAASARVATPTVLVRTASSGSTMERSTWVSAAKLTTTSWPAIASATWSGSQMSPWTNWWRGSLSRSSTLARLPA